MNEEAVKEEKPATTHHSRSMSKWSAILACPCFESKRGGKNADIGTDTHAKLAEWLQEYVTSGKFEKPEDLNMFEGGAWRFARYIVNQMAIDGVDRVHLKIESRVALPSGVVGIPDAYYLDLKEGIVRVFDFKTFRNPGRDYTPQLAGYGLAVAESLPSDVRPLQIVTCVGYGDSNFPDIVELALDECREIERKAMAVFDSVEKSEAINPVQNNWCELCDKYASCEACKALATTATTSLADVPKNWDALSVVEKARMMLLAESVGKWSDAVRERAKETLTAGGSVESAEEGIKYILRAVNGRKTPRTQDAVKALTVAGVDKDAIKGKLKISAADCKALLKGAGLKTAAADAIVADVSDMSAGTIMMVRA